MTDHDPVTASSAAPWRPRLLRVPAMPRRMQHWNWALLDQALVSGTNFSVGILLVRYLGIEHYGRFVLLWMAVQFVMSLQNALIVAPMLSIAPKMPADQRDGYYLATRRLQWLLALGTALIAGALALMPATLRPAWLSGGVMLAVIACLVFMQGQDYLRRNLFSRLASRRAFYCDLVGYGVQLPLLFLLVRAHPSLQTALLVIAGALLLSVLLGYRWLGRAAGGSLSLWQVARRHWVSSRWLAGSAVLQWVSGNYFLIACGALLGPAVVGAIRAAQNLLGLTHILFQGLENIVPGEASSRFQHGGRRALARYIAGTALLMLTGTGLVAVGAAVFAEPLLEFVYGSLDATSVRAMAWYVPIYMLVAVTLPLRAGLRTLELTTAIFIAHVCTALLAVSSASWLINQHGVPGAMAGMLVAEALMTLVLLLALTREVKRR